MYPVPNIPSDILRAMAEESSVKNHCGKGYKSSEAYKELVGRWSKATRKRVEIYSEMYK